jgi:hypothetical protein
MVRRSPISYGLDSHVRPSRSSLSCGLAAHDRKLRRWTTTVNVELLAAPRQSRGISYVIRIGSLSISGFSVARVALML